MRRALSGLRHAINPLVIQVATVAVAGVAVAYIAVFTSSIVERSSRQAADDSNAALLVAEIRAHIDSVALLRLDEANNGAGGSVSITTAVQAHDHLAEAQNASEQLHALVGSSVTLQILGATGEAIDGLDEYFAAQSAESFAIVQFRLEALRALMAR